MTAARPAISLLHATYRRPGGPMEVVEAWLGRAANPDAVEYVVACDADDVDTRRRTDGNDRIVRVVSPAAPAMVTAVRNWNAAAAASSGGLLVVVADDLFPPDAWDRRLLDLTGGLDPLAVPFAVKLDDSPQAADVLMRHPVVSRAFYERLGLFSSDFEGVHCDDDITLRAFWNAVIIDGRSIELRHSHPHHDAGLETTESHARINSDEQYRRGRAAFVARWPERRRVAGVRLVDPAAIAARSPAELTHIAQRERRSVARGYWLHQSRLAPGRNLRSLRRRLAPVRKS